MTLLLLVRHAEHELGAGVLPGRLPGVKLSARGELQARALAARLAPLGVGAIWSSPRRRARDTAAPLAAASRLPVQCSPGLDEIDFGTFTGRTFAELDDDPAWRTWNADRAHARAPGGETMHEVQQRVVAGLDEIAVVTPLRPVVVFGHGDPLRAAVAHCLGLALDALQRFALELASVSVLSWSANERAVLRLNDTGDLTAQLAAATAFARS